MTDDDPSSLRALDVPRGRSNVQGGGSLRTLTLAAFRSSRRGPATFAFAREVDVGGHLQGLTRQVAEQLLRARRLVERAPVRDRLVGLPDVVEQPVAMRPVVRRLVITAGEHE